ncbi:DJ-1/PfpI family protein [Aquidulcibacter sp.]|jgi:putative intracellular protease/amidase|uniref:DJ-1/PfpI family protein n=1 Tax=Aquidulcibacter sp. TaxID=2052990 RepID=UPI003784C3B5
MTKLNRRLALKLAALAPVAASAACNQKPPAPASVGTNNKEGPVVHDMGDMPANWQQENQIAMLVYPKMTALDLVGPQYMFASAWGAKVHLVGKTLDPVISDTGLTILPTMTFKDCPKDLTVLFAPGGTTGTLNAMGDAETIDFMADRGSRATYVTSVCTGSLILAAAGLLKGYKATCHWGAREALKEFGAIPTDARIVKDRNRITGAGVTAGLDFGLQMLAELRDTTYAQGVQLMAEYDPHPPFNAGSPHTAPLHVKALITPMASPFEAEVRKFAKTWKG